MKPKAAPLAFTQKKELYALCQRISAPAANEKKRKEGMEMPFTAAELEEMRRADEEIERNFRWTNEELREARERDAEAKRDSMDAERRKAAERQRAYYEANREKVAECQRWIRLARAERGYTQTELAARIGASQSMIARLESGEMDLERFGKKAELCALLGAKKEGGADDAR